MPASRAGAGGGGDASTLPADTWAKQPGPATCGGHLLTAGAAPNVAEASGRQLSKIFTLKVGSLFASGSCHRQGAVSREAPRLAGPAGPSRAHRATSRPVLRSLSLTRRPFHTDLCRAPRNRAAHALCSAPLPHPPPSVSGSWSAEHHPGRSMLAGPRPGGPCPESSDCKFVVFLFLMRLHGSISERRRARPASLGLQSRCECLPAPSHGLSLQCRHLSSHPPGLAGREAWSPGQRAAWPGRSRDPCGQSACRRRNPGRAGEVAGPLRPHADGPWRRAPPARAAPPHVRPSASALAHARLPSLQGLRTRPPAPGPSPRPGAPSRCAVRSGLRCQWVPGRTVPRVPWPCDPDAWLGERPLFKRTEGQVWHVDTVRTSALSVSPQSSAAAGPRPCCPWEGGSPGGAGSAGQEGAAEGALLWGCGLPRRPEAAASAPWSPMCSPQWHEHHAVALPRGGRARQAPAAAEPPPPHAPGSGSRESRWLHLQGPEARTGREASLPGRAWSRDTACLAQPSPTEKHPTFRGQQGN